MVVIFLDTSIFLHKENEVISKLRKMAKSMQDLWRIMSEHLEEGDDNNSNSLRLQKETGQPYHKPDHDLLYEEAPATSY
jgi:hypothetical protein